MPPYPIDLHTHTHFSDGANSPAELIASAITAGIQTLALTDHDTLAGIAETAAGAEAAGIAFIPGVEISTSMTVRLDPPWRLPVHVLGYGIDLEDEELLDTLAFQARARDRRIRRMVGKLQSLGFAISPERVFALAGPGAVGRVHIALALVETGAATSVSDAFTRLLGRTGPAYVPRPPVDTEATIALIQRAGGVPVLAHPMEYADAIDLDLLIGRLQRAGLLGMETDYGDYPEATRARLRTLAERHDLIATGGSDYHGLSVKPDRPLGLAPVDRAAPGLLRGAIAAVRAEREAR